MIMLITIPVNLFLFGGALLVAFLSWLYDSLPRTGQIKEKGYFLESEMVSNHAEILNLQKGKCRTGKEIEILIHSCNTNDKGR